MSAPLPALPARPRVVVDTDADNEIDDQFAVVHALLAPDRVAVEAFYAAPFHNDRSRGPEDGMLRSRAELERILEIAGGGPPVLEGARAWLPGPSTPVASPAAEDLIARSETGEPPLVVVALAALPTVASGLLLDPGLRERIVVVWLGGHARWWPTAREFNLAQDPHAARVVLGAGVPLVHVPCLGVASSLATTRAEIDAHVRGRGVLGDFLAGRFARDVDGTPGRSRILWDMGAMGWALDRGWLGTRPRPSPVLTDDLTWREAPDRRLVLAAETVDRDAVYGDLFARLAAQA